MPSLAAKIDAVPGRLNQIFLHCYFTGTSWGQCSELCGINHGFMPIEARWLHPADFEAYECYLSPAYKRLVGALGILKQNIVIIAAFTSS